VTVFRPVGGEGFGHLAEPHRRHHGCVSQGLQLHVPAIVGPFQLDDHQAAGFVDRQEVDAPASVLPVAVLLGDDQKILVEGSDVVP